VLVLTDLADSPNDSHVPGALYLTVPNPSEPPLWDGMDVIAIDPASVQGGGVDRPLYEFPNGYLRDDVWVSDDLGASTGPMPVILMDTIAVVQPLSFTLAAQLNAKHDEIASSTVSAVLAVDEARQKLGSVFFELLCDPVQVAMILDTFLLPSADLTASTFPFISDATVCNAMSFGYRLVWNPIKAVTVAAQSPSPSSKCSPSDAGGGG
jgi:hypothetical protein